MKSHLMTAGAIVCAMTGSGPASAQFQPLSAQQNLNFQTRQCVNALIATLCTPTLTLRGNLSQQVTLAPTPSATIRLRLEDPVSFDQTLGMTNGRTCSGIPGVSLFGVGGVQFCLTTTNIVFGDAKASFDLAASLRVGFDLRVKSWWQEWGLVSTPVRLSADQLTGGPGDEASNSPLEFEMVLLQQDAAQALTPAESRQLVQMLATVHAAVPLEAINTGSQFMARLADETQMPTGFALQARAADSDSAAQGAVNAKPIAHGWINAYGTRGRSSVSAQGPSFAQSGHGLTAGMSLRGEGGLRMGLSVDHGTLDLSREDSAARMRLTLLAASVGLDRDDWFATAVLSAGHGRSDTDSVGGSSLADYRLRSTGALGVVGWRFNQGHWRITPSLGLAHQSVWSGSFTGTGLLALEGATHRSSWNDALTGLEAVYKRQVQGGTFEFGSGLRLGYRIGGANLARPLRIAGDSAGHTFADQASVDRGSADLRLRLAYWTAGGSQLQAALSGRNVNGDWARRLDLQLRFVW